MLARHHQDDITFLGSGILTLTCICHEPASWGPGGRSKVWVIHGPPVIRGISKHTRAAYFFRITAKTDSSNMGDLPSGYKRRYNPNQYPHKWVTGVISPSGVSPCAPYNWWLLGPTLKWFSLTEKVPGVAKTRRFRSFFSSQYAAFGEKRPSKSTLFFFRSVQVWPFGETAFKGSLNF